ncbi:MAG: hypothetical protein CMH55_03730 [Myxococcales bacterium]|nr:hypothetical protein [Myxococcales bacterium]
MGGSGPGAQASKEPAAIEAQSSLGKRIVIQSIGGSRTEGQEEVWHAGPGSVPDLSVEVKAGPACDRLPFGGKDCP